MRPAGAQCALARYTTSMIEALLLTTARIPA
jgi:hypothetical protein